MHLVGGITGAAASLVVDVTTGLPSVPFTLLLDPGLGVEEIATVTVVSGTTLTVTRGVDGTSAQSHDNGAEVRHAYSARDFQDSRDHEANTTTAHGATGAVVGTTNTQTLTNKTLDAPTLSGTTTAGPVNAAAVAGTTGTFTGALSASNFQNAVSDQGPGTSPQSVGTGTVAVYNAPSVTGDGVKQFKITASYQSMIGTVAGDRFNVFLSDTTLGTFKGGVMVNIPTGLTSDGATVMALDTPAAGAHVYGVGFARNSGTGAAAMFASVFYPVTIIVEQVA